MPAQDRTGPMGMGPRTGRGFGPCSLGWGRRFGIGRGMGRFFREEELEDVKKEEDSLNKAE